MYAYNYIYKYTYILVGLVYTYKNIFVAEEHVFQAHFEYAIAMTQDKLQAVERRFGLF